MKIKLNLNKSGSFDEAIKELKAYQQKLDSQIEELVRILANDGVVVAKSWLGATQGDSTRAVVGLEIDSAGDIKRAMITLSGRDALFVEFGAGIYYNSTDPPHAAEFGYGVGTYPNQKNAFKNGWYYIDETGYKAYSHGTEGTYPLYHAADNIRNTAIMKALSIFRSGI